MFFLYLCGMKKISTLYKKDPDNLSIVINEVSPENTLVLEGMSIWYRCNC
jgi:hypothetical protein